MKIIKMAWGGFVDGRLDVLKPSTPEYHSYGEPRYAVFKNKAGAKRAYEDVRQINIQIEPKP